MANRPRSVLDPTGAPPDEVVVVASDELPLPASLVPCACPPEPPATAAADDGEVVFDEVVVLTVELEVFAEFVGEASLSFADRVALHAASNEHPRRN